MRLATFQRRLTPSQPALELAPAAPAPEADVDTAPPTTSLRLDADTRRHVAALQAKGWDVLPPGVLAELDANTDSLRNSLRSARKEGNERVRAANARLEETRAEIVQLRAETKRLRAEGAAAAEIAAKLPNTIAVAMREFEAAAQLRRENDALAAIAMEGLLSDV